LATALKSVAFLIDFPEYRAFKCGEGWTMMCGLG
jgi:hypothetical protein